MDWNIAKPLLEAKLDPKHVVKPSGSFGPKGDYIQGWHAIAEANRVFGFDGWSYTIKTMTQDALSEVDKGGKKQWQAAYTCIVTVTVGDVVREDVGFGSGFAAQVGDAIEGATKEAVTDALKRALRTFGNIFGLALYDKSRENVGVTKQPPSDENKRDWVKDQIGNASQADRLDQWWKDKAEFVQSLPQPMQAELQKVYTDKMGVLATDKADAA